MDTIDDEIGRIILCPALFSEFIRQCSEKETIALITLLERTISLVALVDLTSNEFVAKATVLKIILVGDDDIFLSKGMETFLRDKEKKAIEDLRTGNPVDTLYMC